MENASKALIMAGGILVSLLVISIVMMAYEEISSLEQTKEHSKEVEQAAEFNKRFEAFTGDNLQGSVVISSANQIEDYNLREADGKGYDTIHVEVILKPMASGAEYLKEGTYVDEEIVDAYNNLQQEINRYKAVTYSGGKNIDYFINLRTPDFQTFLRQYGSAARYPDTSTQLEYQALKSELSAFKRKLFECTAEYSSTTGRVTKLIFEEK